MKVGMALLMAALGAGALGGVWMHGHRHGGLACEASHAAARAEVERRLMREAEALSLRTLELAEARDALAARAREMEDAARADPDDCRLPASDSLLRLRRRWSED
jgi:hypothetical protein